MEILEVTTEYADYLSDESRRIGTADFIAFPKTEAELIALLRRRSILLRLHSDTSVVLSHDHLGEIALNTRPNEAGSFVYDDCPLTIQGALSGVTGGAVPNGGLIINLGRMNQILKCGTDRMTVQPGVRLAEIRAAIEPKGLFFPPDPTETTASIGGMVSCNASGARSYKYGSTRPWVQSLRVVLADGDTLHLERGKQKAKGRAFELITDSGRAIAGMLPDYQMPAVKNASGYFVHDDMELIDLFIGAEGTLGIITEIELTLLPMPTSLMALNAFMPSQSAALQLVEKLRPLAPAAIEYVDSRALDLMRTSQAEIPAGFAIYVEFIDNDRVMQAAGLMIEFGANEEEIWFTETPAELERLKAFRHATPEAVNQLIAERKKVYPELTKLGTDMSVPDEYLADTLAMYNNDLDAAGLDFVIFGHIGNSHLHVNILPRNMDDYAKGQTLYKKWAARIVALGGSVSAEHGIGKNKTGFLEMMYGLANIEQMRQLKTIFDSQLRLNTGNLFEL